MFILPNLSYLSSERLQKIRFTPTKCFHPQGRSEHNSSTFGHVLGRICPRREISQCGLQLPQPRDKNGQHHVWSEGSENYLVLIKTQLHGEFAVELVECWGRVVLGALLESLQRGHEQPEVDPPTNAAFKFDLPLSNRSLAFSFQLVSSRAKLEILTGENSLVSFKWGPPVFYR